jgi:glycerol-3-phosphate acyltransferase PlsX
VLCDGFVGNVVLKTCEATASAVFNWLKRELTANPKRIAGAALAKNAFRAIRDKTNYETYGGSPLVGVDGVAIIAHGASSALAIKNAVRVACDLIEKRINPRIVEAIAQFHQ